MYFINFLRRVNRGIVLAIVLIIGLSCYLTVDSIAFKDEREAIKQVLEDYTKDMASFLLIPEQYREIGVSVPDSVIEDKIKENNELIGKYFTNPTNRYDWNLKESVSGDLERILKTNEESGHKVKSCDAKFSKVKNITKHGANLVTAEAVINITTTATSNAETFQVFYGFFEGVPDNVEDMTFSNKSYEITFKCEMVKRGDVWMFSNSEGMSTTIQQR